MKMSAQSINHRAIDSSQVFCLLSPNLKDMRRGAPLGLNFQKKKKEKNGPTCGKCGQLGPRFSRSTPLTRQLLFALSVDRTQKQKKADAAKGRCGPHWPPTRRNSVDRNAQGIFGAARKDIDSSTYRSDTHFLLLRSFYDSFVF